jgi:hypothetical protein
MQCRAGQIICVGADDRQTGISLWDSAMFKGTSVGDYEWPVGDPTIISFCRSVDVYLQLLSVHWMYIYVFPADRSVLV